MNAVSSQKNPAGREKRTPTPRFLSPLMLGLAACLLLLCAGSGWVKQAGSQDLERASANEAKISKRLQARILSLGDAEKSIPVWIFFRDKGISSEIQSRKRREEVKQGLRARCLWRRGKVRSQDDLVENFDSPLYPLYVERIVPRVKKVRAVSRWLNAVSAQVTAAQIPSLENLDFIRKLDLVMSFKRTESSLMAEEKWERDTPKNSSLDYGPSYDQLDQMNVIPLHEHGYTGEDVVVCLLDTGFRKTHEIFRQARVIAEWDFVNGDDDVTQDFTDPEDYSDSHGTGTWSACGGYKPGELIGPAYKASFILGKTETTLVEEPVEEDYWVAGLEWAESLGVEVISSSLGYTDWYTFQDMDGQTAVTTLAANRAASLGVVVVNAAGNERAGPWGHVIAPADGFDVIAVGAVDQTGRLASFSSPGPTFDGRIKPDVCARGLDTWIAGNSPEGFDVFQRGSGTSFATPLIAGAAALLLEIHRDWTPKQVRDALTKSADRSFKPDNDYGWGVIDAELAASWDQKKGKKSPR